MPPRAINDRMGEVEGNARVDLTFQVRDINDLIKSMVVQDEKGVVSAVSDVTGSRRVTSHNRPR